MKLAITFLFSVVLSLQGIAQVQYNKTLDFGSISNQGEAYADIVFENKSNKTVYFLRTEPEEELQILLESKSIPPGESKLLRVQVNPARKGGFNKKVELWMSHEAKPLTIRVKGRADFVASSGNIPCPSFNSSPQQQEINKVLEILVVDSLSGQVLSNTEVDVFNSRGLSRSFKTKQDGIFELQVQPGLYGFQIQLNGYQEHLSQQYFSLSDRKHTIFLIPEQQDPLVANNEEVLEKPEPVLDIEIEEEHEEPVEHVLTDKIEEEVEFKESYSPGDIIRIDSSLYTDEPLPTKSVEDSITDSVEPSDTSSSPSIVIDSVPPEVPVSLDSLDLPEEVFAANNIVFLLDVSGSMAKREKLAIMQRSILALLERLRPMDKISLVTYADGVEVLLNGTSASQKEEIESFIMSLKVGGVTEEEKGLRKAYQLAYQNKVDGNNQVILITDGEFDPENSRKKALIFMGLQRGTKLSVVGIKASNYAKRELGEMCEQGNGNLVLSDDFTAAHYKLIQEIQVQSKIK